METKVSTIPEIGVCAKCKLQKHVKSYMVYVKIPTAEEIYTNTTFIMYNWLKNRYLICEQCKNKKRIKLILIAVMFLIGIIFGFLDDNIFIGLVGIAGLSVHIFLATRDPGSELAQDLEKKELKKK